MASASRSSHRAGPRFRRAGLTAALATALIAGTAGATASAAAPVDASVLRSDDTVSTRHWDPCDDRPDWDDVVDWVKDHFDRDDRTWDKGTCEEEPPPPPPDSVDDDCDTSSALTSDRDDDDCPAPPPPPPPPPAPVVPAPPAPQPPPPPAPQKVAAVLPATAYQGELACGASTGLDGVLTTPTVTVTRLTDAGLAAQDCTPVSYSLFNADKEVEFLKPADQPFTQFIFDIEWKRVLGDSTRTETYVDFGLVPAGYELVMPPCPSSLYDAKGELVGLTGNEDPTAEELTAAGIVDQDGLPRAGDTTDNGITQFACVGNRSEPEFMSQDKDAPLLSLREQIYVLGDIFIRR